MFSEKIHRYIYIFSLILLGVSIPFSVFLMSVSQFLLATNWLLELDFINKWSRLKRNKPALYLIALFLLHLIWMLNSTNSSYGWHDIKIKLPLFVLALLIGSTKRLKYSELKLILNFFILAIFSSSIVSALIYYGFTDKEITDTRQISIFISHIRLSLLVNIGIFSAYYLGKNTIDIRFRIFYALIGFWLLFFLFILNAYTGLVIFVFVFGILLLKTVLQKNIWLKYGSILLLASLFIGAFVIGTSYYNRFKTVEDFPDLSEYNNKTFNGNKYKFNRKLKQVENGHNVYSYLCEKEIEKEWNKRSEINYQNGVNERGGELRFTLIHYLSSLGLKKDSVDFQKISDEDIQMIEKGYSNYIYKEKYSLYTKVYPILKQIHLYQETGYAEGASVAQRFEYLKIAKNIINENFWFGVGTGDVDDVFKSHYAKGESLLSEEYQHRAHNQFVTFFIAFGFFGFIASLFFMFAPIYRERKRFLPIVFMLTAFFSMLNEDTLETQAGITFFTYFYILFFVAFSFVEYQQKNSE